MSICATSKLSLILRSANPTQHEACTVAKSLAVMADPLAPSDLAQHVPLYRNSRVHTGTCKVLVQFLCTQIFTIELVFGICEEKSGGD